MQLFLKYFLGIKKGARIKIQPRKKLTAYENLFCQIHNFKLREMNL